MSSNDNITDLAGDIDAIQGLGAYAPRVILNQFDSETPFRRYVAAIGGENGLELETIDEEDLQPFPRRASGDRTVSEVDSFLAELDRRPLNGNGTLWGTADCGKLTAIYNDHDAESPHIGGWRDDRLVLQLRKDADWTAWHNLSGKAFRQQEFGDQVEELLHTVVDPDQADLLEIIDSIRASSTGEFESSIERANGAQKAVYKTEVQARAGRTGQLEVPQQITLRLRPWEGHDVVYDIDAHFRLRIDNSHLLLTIKLKPTRQIIRQAWEDVTSKVTAAVNKPVYAQ